MIPPVRASTAAANPDSAHTALNVALQVGPQPGNRPPNLPKCRYASQYITPSAMRVSMFSSVAGSMRSASALNSVCKPRNAPVAPNRRIKPTVQKPTAP